MKTGTPRTASKPPGGRERPGAGAPTPPPKEPAPPTPELRNLTSPRFGQPQSAVLCHGGPGKRGLEGRPNGVGPKPWSEGTLYCFLFVYIQFQHVEWVFVKT